MSAEMYARYRSYWEYTYSYEKTQIIISVDDVTKHRRNLRNVYLVGFNLLSGELLQRKEKNQLPNIFNRLHSQDTFRFRFTRFAKIQESSIF